KKILPVVRITDASKARRVGKIACRICAAWARRARDFAHAERSSVAPLPTLQTALNRLLWWASYRTTALSASQTCKKTPSRFGDSLRRAVYLGCGHRRCRSEHRLNRRRHRGGGREPLDPFRASHTRCHQTMSALLLKADMREFASTCPLSPLRWSARRAQ